MEEESKRYGAAEKEGAGSKKIQLIKLLWVQLLVIIRHMELIEINYFINLLQFWKLVATKTLKLKWTFDFQTSTGRRQKKKAVQPIQTAKRLMVQEWPCRGLS
jgi:hypothetical protein